MGWAQRDNRRRRGTFRTLTSGYCRRVGALIRSSLATLALELPPGSNLEEIALDAEWLGSGPHDLFADGGRYNEDQARFAKAFVRMEQAARLADALLWASRMSGARAQVRRWIRHRIDRIETQDQEGQDLLFELEIAGRLARWPGLQVELAEPDILIRYPIEHPPLALACKRPRVERSIGRAVEEARRQIRTHGHPGVIVIGLEPVFHRQADGSQPFVYSLEGPDEAQEQGDSVAERIADNLLATPSRYVDPRVAGVYLCGVLTYWSRQPSMYGYRWVRRSVSNHAVDSAGEVMRALDHLLFERVSVRP